jgi:hypothetical protein
MRTLQEWMGHRDISTTERYADYAPSQHETALTELAWADRKVAGEKLDSGRGVSPPSKPASQPTTESSRPHQTSGRP